MCFCHSQIQFAHVSQEMRNLAVALFAKRLLLFVSLQAVYVDLSVVVRLLTLIFGGWEATSPSWALNAAGGQPYSRLSLGRVSTAAFIWSFVNLLMTGRVSTSSRCHSLALAHPSSRFPTLPLMAGAWGLSVV